MWAYRQKSGVLRHNNGFVEAGYSGCDEGKNNPSMQALHDVGPIPAGHWTISGPPRSTAEHGPFVLTLIPSANTNTFGRAGFLMHGDSLHAPGCASKGCIIMSRTTREQVWNSGDRDLEVVAEFETQDLHDESA
jgi:hypothetical protein